MITCSVCNAINPLLSTNCHNCKRALSVVYYPASARSMQADDDNIIENLQARVKELEEKANQAIAFADTANKALDARGRLLAKAELENIRLRSELEKIATCKDDSHPVLQTLGIIANQALSQHTPNSALEVLINIGSILHQSITDLNVAIKYKSKTSLNVRMVYICGNRLRNAKKKLNALIGIEK